MVTRDPQLANSHPAGNAVLKLISARAPRICTEIQERHFYGVFLHLFLTARELIRYLSFRANRLNVLKGADNYKFHSIHMVRYEYLSSLSVHEIILICQVICLFCTTGNCTNVCTCILFDISQYRPLEGGNINKMRVASQTGDKCFCSGLRFSLYLTSDYSTFEFSLTFLTLFSTLEQPLQFDARVSIIEHKTIAKSTVCSVHKYVCLPPGRSALRGGSAHPSPCEQTNAQMLLKKLPSIAVRKNNSLLLATLESNRTCD